MANTSVSYTGNGSLRLYSVTFPYLNQSHVVVTLNGVVTTAFTFPTSASIQFTTAPASGVVIYIHRVTPQTPLVDFVDGSTLTEALLDTATNQAIYIAQEAYEGVATSDTILSAVATASNSAAASSTSATMAANSATDAATSSSSASTSASASASSASAAAASAGAFTLANQAEAEAGTDNVKYLSALRVKQAITAQTVPTEPSFEKRQCILSGARTATGQPDLITQAQVGATLATGVVTNGAFLASVGFGFNADGSQHNVNYFRTTPLSFLNLTASATNFLYYDTNGNTGSFTTVADAFQAGGTIPTTLNQHTYDTVNHIMWLGFGGSVNQANRIIIAEVDTNATVVTAIRVRAYGGKYDSGYTNTLVGAAGTYTKNHNMGTQEVTFSEVLQCITAELNYVAGDVIKDQLGTNSTYAHPAGWQIKNNTITTRRPASAAYSATNMTTGGYTSLTAANWKYKVVISRNF